VVILDYQISPSWDAKSQETDLATADQATLRYKLLLGDVTFIADDHDFSAKWGWVPIVDFAASLHHVVARLSDSDGAETVMEFTESDAVLRFKRQDKWVAITASYASGEARISLKELVAAVKNFMNRIASEHKQRYPLLTHNIAFTSLLATGGCP
jgi:hypothetical protein